MYYVNNKNLIQVDRADEDFLLYGVHPVKAGQLVATDSTGLQYVIEDEDQFYNEHEGVRKFRKTKTKPISDFALQYAEQLANFSLESNEESDEYITGQFEMTRNKLA